MATTSTGLGRGLDELIRQTGEASPPLSPELLVPVGNLVPNPHQPRRRFAEESLRELTDSIRSQGLLQPLLVRPLTGGRPGAYEIVAGERRWRACQLAGLQEVPVVVRNFSDAETLAAALIENLQREDLNPLEEAQGIQALKEEFGISQEDLAARLGKSRSAIANSLRLLSLPEEARRDVGEGRLTPGHARALLSVTEERARNYLRNLILEEALSVRESESLAVHWKRTGRFLPAAERASSAAGFASSAPAFSGQDFAPHPPGGTCAEAAPPGREHSARLLDIQARVQAVFGLPVRVTGRDGKGKISLTYSSREELDAFLAALAEFQSGSSREQSAPGDGPSDASCGSAPDGSPFQGNCL
ncbi:MAG: ParB/RepB/Spo0J family partition protein [Desulfovibrio sp.]|jgi:ParB family chromosome partitioning protein|nr:ParB/RepB/Spo0J family partition protein [Desulfovibrio sp.]